MSVSFTMHLIFCTGGEDFMPVILNVTFDVGETMINITVPIIPDMIVEGDERFYVQLEGFEGEPNTISLPDGAWVTIIDDDSKFTYVCIYKKLLHTYVVLTCVSI